LIGATTFWFFNALNKSYTTSISYPVKFEFDETQYIPVSKLPDKIQINLTGGGWNLLRRTNWFNIEPLTIRLIDPLEKSISGGSFRADVSDQLDEFQLNFIVTDSLHFNIERRISKDLKLFIDSTALPLQQNYFLVGPIKLSHDSALFQGPESMVNLLPDSFLIKIPQSNIDESFSKSVKINAGADELFVVTPPEIEVSFDVKEFERVNQTLSSTLVNFPKDSSWFVSNPDVVISYMVRKDKPGIDLSQFEVILDLRRMVKSDSTILPILKAYPKEVVNIRLESDRIKISHD